MKVKVYDLEGKNIKEIELPEIFNTMYRKDVIKKAVLIEQANKRQSYGTDILAGKRTSAHYHGRRGIRHTMMNREMSRLPRIHSSGGFMYMRARFAPHATKGRKAHPPKTEKIWKKKINKKEHLLAIKSALSASTNSELVKKRGHKVKTSPIVFINEFENIKKTKDAYNLLKKFAKEELERCKKKKVRAGKGKRRGRKYRKKKGFLIIVSGKKPIIKAVRNLPGIDVITPEELTVELLAPGAHPGRALILSEASLKKLGELLC